MNPEREEDMIERHMETNYHQVPVVSVCRTVESLPVRGTMVHHSQHRQELSVCLSARRGTHFRFRRRLVVPH